MYEIEAIEKVSLLECKVKVDAAYEILRIEWIRRYMVHLVVEGGMHGRRIYLRLEGSQDAYPQRSNATANLYACIS